ncbi:hypothetical protein GWI33_019891 [Rhynchophorus ferrugineus]|uniref:Uncharacterized protein n=1 Tax=Rhynchophorus ferrugineus TaxID=354439 RepID=A0A834I4G2_RHYFE|nr:hypothetical protein GWI33_019891 [Rhynchophorus ferrugineus]
MEGNHNRIPQSIWKSAGESSEGSSHRDARSYHCERSTFLLMRSPLLTLADSGLWRRHPVAGINDACSAAAYRRRRPENKKSWRKG